ncbi:MAG: EcsC family protein [candidate division KSB1 bacterium]|nr:EcsC family protein [candidate division KSB1 bacterium]MDZ7376444.1 EcsC family protein [candidate division KSB1 bacterium]MDZ7399134.1 EcsC family protein [candidate division KSB1 bacterium]
MRISLEDFAALREAKRLLESPSFAAKISHKLGLPIERGLELLPENWAQLIQLATRKAIEKALRIAIKTIDSGRPIRRTDLFHKLAVAASGATGGAFGWMGFAMELPVSTVIMLRSIAEIARAEGEDINSAETMLNCLQIFALGGPTEQDNASETGYYAVRAALSKAVADAARHIASRGLAEDGAPVLVRLIALIASRFGVVVTEKAAAMAIPTIGAIGGAIINTIFIDHFQNIARGHFTIRRLERRYGANLVKKEYQKIIT